MLLKKLYKKWKQIIVMKLPPNSYIIPRIIPIPKVYIIVIKSKGLNVDKK